MEKLINAIFTPTCLICEKRGKVFCDLCLDNCRVVEYDFCIVCDKFSKEGKVHDCCRTSFLPTKIFSCFLYEGKVRLCLKRAKYGARTFAALKVLIKAGIDHAKKCGLVYKDVVLIPVPLSTERYKRRGFNQAVLIAKELGAAFGLKVEERLLKRCVHTQGQYLLGRTERFKNLENAFELNSTVVSKYSAGTTFVLVDDVCTTGATLLSVSKLLYLAGVLDVQCFTLCKKFKDYV